MFFRLLACDFSLREEDARLCLSNSLHNLPMFLDFWPVIFIKRGKGRRRVGVDGVWGLTD
jgi:hypothetical protein